MVKSIRKVGTSLGVILPTRELRRLGVHENTPVQIAVEDGVIKLYPLVRHAQISKVEHQAQRIINQYATAIDALAER